jgi:hypothetical protein
MNVKSERILIFGFDVTQQEIEYQGMTFTPYKNKMGHITGLVIKGKEGTAVVKRSDDPAGLPLALIRVYKLGKITESQRYEYKILKEEKNRVR